MRGREGGASKEGAKEEVSKGGNERGRKGARDE